MKDIDAIIEAVQPTVDAMFMIGETLVDVSKSHISPETAIERIRRDCCAPNVLCTRHRLREAIKNAMDKEG